MDAASDCLPDGYFESINVRPPLLPRLVQILRRGRVVAGNDGGPARESHLNTPSGIDFNDAGDRFITDTGNHAVRTEGILRRSLTVSMQRCSPPRSEIELPDSTSGGCKVERSIIRVDGQRRMVAVGKCAIERLP